MAILPYGPGKSTNGTVTAVSVVTANGVSATVATPTTTPAITVALGAITPTSVASTGAVTGTNLSGTNTGDQTNITGNAATVTTNANLLGPITSAGNTTSVASQTGTGSKFVMDTSPTIATPSFTGNVLSAGPMQDSGQFLANMRGELFSNFVSSGYIWSFTAATLTGAMTAGIAYMTGLRVTTNTQTGIAFTASQDTYVSVAYGSVGVLTYTAVTNGAASPALPAFSMWLAKVISGATAITSIVQYGLDSNGKYIYPLNLLIGGQQGWIAPTLINSWVNYAAGGYNNAAYMKDSLGFVHLKGLVKLGTINTAIFVLPVGFRPGGKNNIATAANNLFALIEIDNVGNVNASTGSNAFFSMDNITFRAEN